MQKVNSTSTRNLKSFIFSRFWYYLLMIEKFNGIFYLIVFLVHFIGFAYYGFRCVFQTQSFLNQYGMDATGASIVRFFGSIFIGSTLMAIYVGFIRPNGLEATWGFFNVIF